MKKTTSKYNPKSREDYSNSHRKTPHAVLLKEANVKKYDGLYEIKSLDNGRIIVQSEK